MKQNDFLNYWEYFLYIDNDLMNTNKYLYHSEKNLEAYSPEFARIILITCAEIDTVCRIICKEIDHSCNIANDTNRSGNIKEYCKIILGQYPKLPTTEIYLSTLKKPIIPWKGWQNRPTDQSPKWWEEYQKIKHYRHSNFEKATLENALFAVSALMILLMYLHKRVFSYTRSVKMNSPGCFFTQHLLDIDPTVRDEYNAEQLPDYV